MIPGVSGRLISSSFALDVLPDLTAARDLPAHVARACSRWNAVREAALGPASGVRAIADLSAAPLLGLLGYAVSSRRDAADRCELLLTASSLALPALVVPWLVELDAVWRDAVRLGAAADARWCFCTNGRALRLVDTQRTWSRQHLEFDLASAAHVPETLRLLWSVAAADAMAGADPRLDRLVELSARHGVAVCRTLAGGVLEALEVVVRALARAERRAERSNGALLDQSLTVLYRVLFLLFAEARGLVPTWHPIYRESYTIDAIVEALMVHGRRRGIWAALQAIARLAHSGCHAGDLRVTAFNGRLFSPLYTPAGERKGIDDAAIGHALLAVATAPNRRAGRTRIRYRDLDVEQLGAVYEHVLDYEAVRDAGSASLRRTGDLRKASGTYYTPRPMTGHLVRQTLAPLVRGRSAADILRLRIVDPAMGSGAFLVAACRYLAGAVEAALVRDGEWHAADVTGEARVMLRRQVAQHCLFGVDLNPMAVQLARLSLWLATLAGDRPLTFLDHRLAVGDSLAGASVGDVLARPPGRNARQRADSALPLFEPDVLAGLVREMVSARVRLADEADEDAEIVRRKEVVLTRLRDRRSPFARWKALLDLWCACWFWEPAPGPDARLFHALADVLLRGGSFLPEPAAREWLARAAAVAERRRFLHWELEFPEVFFDASGQRSPAGGFDAVLGNPPWDMVRGDSGDRVTRGARRAEARQLLEFARGSGAYTADPRAHVNRYQLFVERGLQLARPGGRIGLVLPAGAVSDAGSAPLRRHLFDRAAVDTVVGLDNRAGIFPVHRSVRFVLLTATTGTPTTQTSCRFGVTDAAELDGIGESDRAAPAFPIVLRRALLARMSGEDDLAMPELVSPADLRIVEGISARYPWLSSADGWRARFGRELNASDDREAFEPWRGARDARPVLEGKHIGPFRVSLERVARQLRTPAAFKARVPRRARLAYRDVASAGNRLTLIAAIVPARAVTTHTLFCLKSPLSCERQLVLCALLNSLVANYLVRLRVNTHVTAAIVSRLPMPVPADSDPLALRLAALARALADAPGSVEAMPEYAELQAGAARAYGLSPGEFEHIVATFPLLAASVRRDCVARLADPSSPVSSTNAV